jgi:tetratricopeptide (TPR) repeat protein
VYRLHVADSYLYDGQYAEAARIYGAVLKGVDADGVDSLTSWAHRGLALADAFEGRNAQAASHYAQALGSVRDARTALRDTIEMLIVTGQHDAAARTLDRVAQSAPANDADARQYVQAFRALNIILSGHCTAALEALATAPEQNRPIPRVVRGRCASKRGERVSALALRDSVLKEPVPDPFAWSMIIVRAAARKIR